MKKIIVCVVALLLLMAACGVKEDLPSDDLSGTSSMVDEAFFLNGELLEINDGSLLIDTEEAGLCWVSFEEPIEIDLTIHSIVRVRFGGEIMESYPCQARGYSIEVVEPYLIDAVISYDDMNDQLADGDVNHVVQWNGSKDKVAYATVDMTTLDGSYRVFVADVYKGQPIEIAYVSKETPDLNWFYNKLEVQTSSGFFEFGPVFDEGEVIIIGELEETDPVEVNKLDYELTKHLYEKPDAQVQIEYFQVRGMVGELVQDYINQSLYEVVDVFGQSYNEVTISASILKEDDFLTVAYEGVNNQDGYSIERYLTIDMKTSTVLDLKTLIEDQEGFESLFEKITTFDYKTLEGVAVYLVEDFMVFTFVPTDDQAEREHFKVHLLEVGPYLNMNFEMPAS